MTQPPLVDKLKGTVEADETYIGGKVKGKGRGYKGNKMPVLTLVERGGNARSQAMKRVTGANLKGAIRRNVEREATIMTDSFRSYSGLDKEFAGHHTVDHSTGEYVRGDVYTNTVEGYFANLKRGVTGVYHHWSEQHLHRYLAEFDFRYNGRKLKDGERTVQAIEGAEGKRLMLKDPHQKMVAPDNKAIDLSP